MRVAQLCGIMFAITLSVGPVASLFAQAPVCGCDAACECDCDVAPVCGCEAVPDCGCDIAPVCGCDIPTSCGCEVAQCGCGILSGGHCRQPFCSRLGLGCMQACGESVDGFDPFFSCGCNGSYKFPVPPWNTYHWAGMYSNQLMTDYHSPWRFPPIKPYQDETIEPQERIDGESAQLIPRRATPAPTVSASFRIRLDQGRMESMSEKLKRYYGN